MRKKTIIITVLALLGLTLPALAAVTDFTADGNIVVAGVTLYEGGSTDDLLILTDSTSESFNFSGGVLTVTNPGSAFKVGSSNSTVKSVYIQENGVNVACATNDTPGTSAVTLPTTAADYIVYPSANTDFATTDCCAAVSHAASYNAFPTCGPATCASGYYVSGGSCVLIGGGGPSGGGGGGGSVSVASPSPSPSSSPSPSPSVSPSPNSTVNEIKEGALIRAKGDFDVYIVKYIGDKKFKRLVLSPSVFNSYKHLKWSDVMNIDKSVLDTFTTSELVRAVGDPKVYKLYPAGDTGQKRWIKTAEGFNRMSFDWSAIYEINSTDRNSYTTGSIIE